MSTFEDILAAGRIEEKLICVRGVEFVVKPLTIKEALELDGARKEGNDIDAVLAMLCKAIVSPEIESPEKLKDCSAAFIHELSEAVAAAIKPDTEAAEKN